jgi:hypothetical protein
MLNRVVRQIDVDPAAWLLTTFFRISQESEKEEIHFDVENEQPRITPFVSPLRAGRIVEHEGYETRTFKPAYAKDKRLFDADAPIKRVIGEAPLGTLSNEERTRRLLGQTIANQNRMLTRREEVMASEVLRTGKATITGEGFDDVVVDFLRDASLTVAALTGAARWSETTSTPMDDLEAWAQLIYDAGGGIALDVVMAPDVWQAIRTHAQVKDLLDTRRGSESRAETGPLAARRVRNPGQLGDFNLWVYQDNYIDEDGVAGQMMPSGTVHMVNGDGLQGTRHYGTIKDFKASHRAQRIFAKSWEEEDPSRRLLLLQCAPLVVPYRPNSSLSAEVLNGGA